MIKPFSVQEAIFSSAELELITGVSAVTLRDWRRRGFLKKSLDGKHRRFMLVEVAHLSALQQLIETGIPIGQAQMAAGAAAAPIYDHAVRADTIARGGSEAYDKIASGKSGSDSDKIARYAVTFKSSGSTFRCGNLAALQELLDESPQPSPVFVVIDCEFIGKTIQQKAGKPLRQWTFE